MKSLMDNKEELQSMKERFARLGIVEDIVTVRGGEDAEYNVNFSIIFQSPHSIENTYMKYLEIFWTK